MKNIFKLFIACAFATLGFSACQQEEINYNEETATHTVTFIAESPETKTTVDISDGNTAIFAWTAADVNRFTVYENGTEATETVGNLDVETGIMTLSATFTGDAPASPKYQALYNSEVSTTQCPDGSYAEVTDVMVSNVLDGTRDNTFIFSFKREVSFAKMTLKGLTSGAYVSSVTIESDKPIAGQYDLKTGTFIKTSNVITLDVLTEVADENATVWFTTIPVEEATFTITATTVNNDETVAGTYTKTFTKTITLTRGDVKGFGVAMEKDVVAAPMETYNRITSQSDLEDGEYVIGMALDSAPSTIKYLVNTTKTKPGCTDITGDISISQDCKTINLNPTTITNAKWLIKSVDGGFSISSMTENPAGLATISDNDGLTTQTKYLGTAWSITVEGETNACTMKYVSTSRYLNVYTLANPRTYTSSSTNNKGKVYLYKRYDPRTVLPTPTNLAVNAEKVVSWNAVDGAASYVLTIGTDEYPCPSNSYDASAIEDEYYDVAVVAVPSDTKNYKNSAAATLTNAKFGTPTLTAPTLKEGAIDEFSVNATWAVDPRATAGYNCELYKGVTKVGDSQTVNKGSVTFDGLDDGVTYTVKVNAIAVEGAKAYAASAVATIDLTTKGTVTLSQITEEGTYTVKNVTVYAVIGTNTAVIGDGTAYLYMYKSNHGLAVGNNFNVGGTVSLYNNVLQFNNPTISNKTTGSTPAYENPVEANEEYLTSYASAPVTEFVHAKGSQSGRNVTVGSQKLYLSTNNTTTDGKDVEVYGFVYGYNSDSSYAYFYATSIAEDPTAPKLSVTPTSKTWASDETGPAVFTVTTNTEGENGWSVSPTTLGWATIAVDKSTGTITVTPNDANDADTPRGATLTVIHAAGDLSETITLTQSAAGAVVTAKQYTLTITPSSFNTDSYDANNKDKTTQAVAEDGSTIDVTWYSNQIMLQSKAMQWQKNTAYLYNKTDLGEIKSVTVNSTAGTFTTYYGSTQNPTSGTIVGGGYFNVKVGSATGKTTSVVVVFKK